MGFFNGMANDLLSFFNSFRQPIAVCGYAGHLKREVVWHRFTKSRRIRVNY